MSRLDELIQEKCSNGVEYVPLWSVTIWDKKFSSVDRKKQPKVKDYPYLLASDLFALQVDNGNVFLLSTGEQTGWTTEELAGKNLREGEVVTIPWGKSRAVTDCIKYYKGKFVTADNRIMTSNDAEKLNNKYLYYWIMSQGKTIDTFYRGSGIKHPDMAKVLDMEMPIPPIEVQREIVRILDNFTNLTAELTANLTAELTARKTQYSYYRDKLLTIETDIHKYVLGEIATVTKLAGFEFTNYVTYSESGNIIALRGLNVKNGKLDLHDVKYIDKSDFSKLERSKLHIGDMLFTYVGTVGQVAIVDKEDKYYLAPNVALIRCDKEILLPQYMKYYFQTTQFWDKQIRRLLQSSSMQNIPMEKIRKFEIAVPSLDVQSRIVNVLDNFEKICSDLNIGLPAEIEARQKQYEYYRDKLLTFVENGNTILSRAEQSRAEQSRAEQSTD